MVCRLRPAAFLRDVGDGEVTARLVAKGFACAILLAALPATSQGLMAPRKIAVLQALDKVTARITKIEVGVGKGIRFGSLLITVRTCSKRPPEEPPEVTAFLEIIDDKPGEAPENLFSGWMFASSPALSAVEHPVYDVWVIDCVPDDSGGFEGLN